MREVFPWRENLGKLKILLESQESLGQLSKIVSENKKKLLGKEKIVVSVHIFLENQLYIEEKSVSH